MVAQNGSTTPKPAAPIVRVPRLTIETVVHGKVRTPLRLLLHGSDGVGKTTFAASAPGAIIIPTEDGANEIDVPKFKLAESFDDVRDAIRALTVDKHDFKTAVLDSLDWTEAMVFKHVCARDGSASIAEAAGGYGKGYDAALDQWRVVMSDLERLQRDRQMNVILIAHSTIKTHKNPEGQDYDRYIVKMHERSAALWREWCQGVYFCNFEILAKEDKKKRVRGVSTGSRYLHTQKTGAYDAKDRYALPERLPLAWDDFQAAYEAGQPADPAALIAEVKRKAAELGGEIEAWTLGMIADPNVASSASKLSTINTRLNAKLGERQEQAAEQQPTAA